MQSLEALKTINNELKEREDRIRTKIHNLQTTNAELSTDIRDLKKDDSVSETAFLRHVLGMENGEVQRIELPHLELDH